MMIMAMGRSFTFTNQSLTHDKARHVVSDCRTRRALPANLPLIYKVNQPET